MGKFDKEINRRRTFAIISHPDAGKTTLTEKFLLYGGAINLAGSVKGKATARHAVSDWMEIEKERGISVTSSVLQFEYDDYCINILDTPGHQDFSEDTYRTLMAADSAVMVIDASKGVEAQTRKLFKVCGMRGIPIFTFINKLDRDANDTFELLASMDEAAKDMENRLVLLPNIPCKLIKPGKGAEDNEVVKMGGPEPVLPANALPHWDLAKKYDLIDFDLGVKITGAGFPVYKGKGAKLQRALINFFLDCNTEDGYLEVEPPVVVNKDSGFGTGQLPDKEGQMYHAEVDDFYLVPTAEVPVTNIFRDVILAAIQERKRRESASADLRELAEIMKNKGKGYHTK